MSNNSTASSWGLTVLRVVVGAVFLAHGGQKLFVFGFHGVAGFFAQAGIPLAGLFSVVVPLVEFLGGAALVLGAGTRVAAALLAIDMAGAILFVHIKGGFFMPTGVEFALTVFAANICLVLAGAGPASVDGLIAKKP